MANEQNFTECLVEGRYTVSPQLINSTAKYNDIIRSNTLNAFRYCPQQ